MKLSLGIVLVLSAVIAAGSEKKVQMKDLPAAVQKAVAEQSHGATVRGLSKEVEAGKTSYEAELSVNGRTKDISFDAAGKVLIVEEEMAIDSVPAAARDAIQKSLKGGKLKMVEAVTEKGATTYEAHVSHGLKSSEVKVDAAGKPVK